MYKRNLRLENPIYYGTNPDILKYARINRNGMTLSEKNLWDRIKGKQLNGCRFRRQHPIAKFIADFYCHEARLVIEIDGGYHNSEEQKAKDSGREAELKALGLSILRFTNAEIESDLDSVISEISEHLTNH